MRYLLENACIPSARFPRLLIFDPCQYISDIKRLATTTATPASHEDFVYRAFLGACRGQLAREAKRYNPI